MVVPPLNVLMPSEVAPSKNSTVPVGVPLLLETVAVKVTGELTVTGFADEATVVVVVALLIVNDNAGEVAALNAARIAGKSDEEIRALVVKLEAARKAAA